MIRPSLILRVFSPTFDKRAALLARARSLSAWGFSMKARARLSLGGLLLTLVTSGCLALPQMHFHESEADFEGRFQSIEQRLDMLEQAQGISPPMNPPMMPPAVSSNDDFPAAKASTRTAASTRNAAAPRNATWQKSR